MELPEGDVTGWLRKLAGGDQEAAQAIWERYFEKLVRLARKYLAAVPRRAADEEDVALSAFDSFCRGVRKGRFPRLNDRHDLWKLLVTITLRKAAKHHRHHRTEKRGGGRVRSESALRALQGASDAGGIHQVMAEEPTPEWACMVADTLQHLLHGLEDESLRLVAQLKMEGYTHQEIAARLNCTVRTVRRKLERIRRRWKSVVA
ncbi:MAG TPA: sigma-70 family RNA polymerase sigma factor [Planctomycetaceae bacterium]|nr:sigma-70 family RNA polymerase sigma factor [Planctomycetaceae bacterium]HIQ19737.1 sigma-70 family RNA polymerase sigma factor [Planctomycetota bacterium]